MMTTIALGALADRYDLLVVGAGPAGMAAATLAARAGLRVLVADDGPSPGGQIYRGHEAATPALRARLGGDYEHGGRLIADFRASAGHYLPGATAWGLEAGPRLALSAGGQSRVVQAGAILLATGAMERPFPVPGWTLPGVMGVGGAQTLLKSAGLVPEGAPVIAGGGPLVWLYAWQMLQLDRRPLAILETTPGSALRAGVPALAQFLLSPYAAKGLRLMAAVRARVPVFGAVTDLRIAEAATGGLEAIFRSRGKARRLTAGVVLLHQGVIPNASLASAAGCAMQWDDAQALWRPATDARGKSSLAGVWIAGDAAGIGGARAAEEAGRLAALDVLSSLDRLAGAGLDAEAEAARKGFRRAIFGRALIDTLYTPPAAARRGPAEAIVCRCEALTGERLSEAAKTLAVAGPNQLKALLRCGMGPCQGRMCGPVLTEVIAHAQGRPQSEVGPLRQRPPVKPMTVGELARTRFPPAG